VIYLITILPFILKLWKEFIMMPKGLQLKLVYLKQEKVLSRGYGITKALLESDKIAFVKRTFRDIVLLGAGTLTGLGLNFLSEKVLHLSPIGIIVECALLLSARLFMTDKTLEDITPYILRGLHSMDQVDFVKRIRLTDVLSVITIYLNTINIRRLYVVWEKFIYNGEKVDLPINREFKVRMYNIARGIKTVANGVIAGFLSAGFIGELKH